MIYVNDTCESLLSADIIQVDEDHQIVIANVSVQDIDESYVTFAPLPYRLNIKCNYGNASLPHARSYGLMIHQRYCEDCYNNNNYSEIETVGTLAQLNSALETLTYIPRENYNGPDYCSMYIHDRPYDSAGGLESNQTIPLFVNSIADTPLMQIDSNQLYLDVAEDYHILITGVSVSDPDFTVITAGAATYSRDTGNHPFDKYNDSILIEHVPPFEKVYNSWNLSTFLQQEGDMLQVTVSSLYGSFMLGSTRGLNFLRTPNATLETLRLSDYPDNLAALEEKELYLGMMGSYDPKNYIKGNSRQLWWKLLTMEGRLIDINDALQAITYKPDTNWNSLKTLSRPDYNGDSQSQRNSADTSQLTELDFLQFTVLKPVNNLTYDVDTVYANETSTAEIQIKVHPVNDPPRLMVPGAIYDLETMTGTSLLCFIDYSVIVHSGH